MECCLFLKSILITFIISRTFYLVLLLIDRNIHYIYNKVFQFFASISILIIDIKGGMKVIKDATNSFLSNYHLSTDFENCLDTLLKKKQKENKY